MDKKVSIQAPFFEHPSTTFHIREIAKRTKINHTTIRQYLQKLEQEGYLIKNTQSKPYETYLSNPSSSKFKNLKLYYNLEKIRLSNIIEKLEKEYDYPTIILFGSFSKALDDEQSDVDLCIISNITKEIELKSFEKIIRRTISFHLYNKQKWNALKKQNPALINSICNGLVLSGQLEVL